MPAQFENWSGLLFARKIACLLIVLFLLQNTEFVAVKYLTFSICWFFHNSSWFKIE